MTPIQQIKSALRFDDYVARHMEVRNKKAICPFHKEKTPSLSVHDTWYFCHGCGASGDLITFAAGYHGISTGQAVRMLAHELGIPLTRQPEPHPYDAAKEARLRAEAQEWRRLLRRSMIEAEDYDTSIPFLEDLESMTHKQALAAYLDQRTAEQGAALRDSMREHAKPTVESMVNEFLQWSR